MTLSSIDPPDVQEIQHQRLVLEIVAEQKELEEHNRKLIAKGTPLEEVKSTPMPNGFESFFDQHQLELKTMDRERLNLFTALFYTDLDNELDTFFRKPGVFRFRGWGLERQLSRVAADHATTMREEIEKLEEELPDIPFVMGVAEKDEDDLTDIPLHVRGSPKNLGEPVPRGFPIVLQDGEEERYTEGSGRLQLATDIANHPITARVVVNRVWAWHMGAGIVRTPSNFGVMGDRPTNPELLEFLAADFVENGHSIKRLHRQIMLSEVYRLAADDDPRYADIDPDNHFFWRFNRQRLTAEAIRDGLLHVSGELDPKVGGESFQLDDDDAKRRTLYGEVSRFEVDEYLQTFDFPNPSLTAERRFSTNVPLQSLYFMNSDFVHRQAESFVLRLGELASGDAPEDDATGDAAGSKGPSPASSDEKGTEAKDDDAKDDDEGEDDDGDRVYADDEMPKAFDDAAMIEAAYPLLYAREVTDAERALGLEFLGAQREAHLAAELERVVAEEDEDVDGGSEPSADQERSLAERRASMKAWVQYSRALFSAAEFRFIS